MRNLSRIVFILILLLCIMQAVYYYPLLPDRVAVHFDASGHPNAWAGKGFFMKIYLGALIFISVLFAGIGIILRRTPASLINLPNKGFWLSPERAQETLDILSLILDIFHQAFKVHLGNASVLEHPVASIATYIAFSVLWSIGLIAKFTRRP